MRGRRGRGGRSGMSGHGRASARRLPWSVGVLVTVMLLGQLAGMVDAGIRPAVLTGSLVVLDLIGAVASVGAARRGINRLSWVMYGVARAFGVANTVFLAAAYLGGGPAFWWIGTLSRYVTVLLFSAGLLIVPLRRLSGGYRQAFVAEIATVLAGGFMLTWYFVLDPVMAGN